MSDILDSYRVGNPGEQHIFNHYDPQGPKINVKVEKNSRGYNFEVTVTGASSVDEALALVHDADTKLRLEYRG